MKTHAIRICEPILTLGIPDRRNTSRNHGRHFESRGFVRDNSIFILPLPLDRINCSFVTAGSTFAINGPQQFPLVLRVQEKNTDGRSQGARRGLGT